MTPTFVEGIRHTHGRRGLPSAGLFIFAVWLAMPSHAARAAFVPLTCSSSAWSNPIPMNLGATRFDANATIAGNYINNTNFSWVVAVNPNVTAVKIHTPGFTTEPNFDTLMINGVIGSTWTGTIPALFTSVSPTGAANAEKVLNLNWTADFSNTGTPPLFDQAQFLCSGSHAAANTVSINGQGGMAEGLLMGTGDVVYFSTTQQAFSNMQIGLEGLGTSPGTDLDLFAATSTALPDSTNATWVSESTAANEFLSIPPPPTLQRTIFIGVHAFSGGGHFSVHVTSQTLSSPHSLKVCTPGFKLDPSTPQFANFATDLKNTSLRLLSASRGNYWIHNYDVYQSQKCNVPPNTQQWCTACDSTCQICMMAPDWIDACTPGQSLTGLSSRVANITCPQYAPSTQTIDRLIQSHVWSHEWGHSQVGFGDEYYGNGSFCGHTLMNGPSNSNFWCSAFSHCRDGVTLPNQNEPACASGTSNWQRTPASWVAPSFSTEPDIELFNSWNQTAMDSVSVTVH